MSTLHCIHLQEADTYNITECEHWSAQYVCYTGPCYRSLQTKLTQDSNQKITGTDADQATLAAMP